MIQALFAAVVVLTALTLLNLVACLAIIRRLRAGGAGPDDWTSGMPAIGTVVTAFAEADVDGRPVGHDDIADGDGLVLFLAPGCGACDRLVAEVVEAERHLPPNRIAFVLDSADTPNRDKLDHLVASLRNLMPVVLAEDEVGVLQAFGGVTRFPSALRISDGRVTATDYRLGHLLETVGSGAP